MKAARLKLGDSMNVTFWEMVGTEKWLVIAGAEEGWIQRGIRGFSGVMELVGVIGSGGGYTTAFVCVCVNNHRTLLNLVPVRVK